jgi:hypothetical protein
MLTIPTINNHAFIIELKNMVEVWHNFHWMKLQHLEILKIQLEWHQHRGVMVCYHCHFCLQEGPMEENH